MAMAGRRAGAASAALAGAGLSASLLLTGAAARAQEAAAPRSLLEPSIAVTQTFTNNVDLTSESRAESITQVTPSVHWDGHSAKIRGSVDYALSAIYYARDGDRNQLQNALRAALHAEPVENRLTVDGYAAISQQSISAYGVQNNTDVLDNGNRSEVRTLGIAPMYRAPLGSSADLTARLGWNGTQTSSAAAGDSQDFNALVALAGGRGVLRWGVDLSRQVNDYKAGRRTTDDRATASLAYLPVPEWRLSLRGGAEREDVLTGSFDTRGTWGASIDWRPSERTQLTVETDRRYFGNSHRLSFQHRTGRTIWRYTDTRGVVGDTSGASQTRPPTVYELLYEQFASSFPDPTLRDRAVRSFLVQNGLDPNSRVTGGFLSNALSLERARTASVALLGVRSTVTLTAFQTSTRRVDEASNATDDLSLAGEVRQFGFAASLSHRLTPAASLAATAALQRTLDSDVEAGNLTRTYMLVWSSSLGPRSSGSLGVRRAVSSSRSSPYNESALFGTFALRF